MLKNKVVLVTGGSAGIGAATAERFAKEGALVAIVGRNEDRLKAVAERCGPATLAIKADLGKDDEVDSIVKQTVDKFGQLDVLVNNAGLLKQAPVGTENFLDVFDEIMNVNIRGPARLTHYALPHLIKTKGNIVNISSVGASSTSRPNRSAYRTSKAALNHFTRCCAFEFAPHGVRVNTISPGPVYTSLFDNVNMSLDALKGITALKKVSESEELADLIVYVASDKGKSITGSEYVMDNGTLLM